MILISVCFPSYYLKYPPTLLFAVTFRVPRASRPADKVRLLPIARFPVSGFSYNEVLLVRRAFRKHILLCICRTSSVSLLLVHCLDFSTVNLGNMPIVMDKLETAKHPVPGSHTERWSTPA